MHLPVSSVLISPTPWVSTNNQFRFNFDDMIGTIGWYDFLLRFGAGSASIPKKSEDGFNFKNSYLIKNNQLSAFSYPPASSYMYEDDKSLLMQVDDLLLSKYSA
jgi:hypothetical protein